MARLLVILPLVAAAFWVFTIVDCSVQPATRHRGVSKPIWILIVVLIPVLGGILWLTVGRLGKAAIARRRAPDDDPEFLGKIGVLSDQDERIRRLEEELAQLDAEDDDPKWTTPGEAASPAASGTASPTASGTTSPDKPARGTDLPSDGDDDTRGQRGVVS